jgi:SAM-dependent methyltransferase
MKVPIPLDQQLSYSLRRQHVDEFLSRKILQANGEIPLLDIGGVKDEYRGKFKISDYRSNVCVLNISTTKQIDIRADASCLPIKDSSYGWVLCSEVLEHVGDPTRVIKEAYRVLKPGGYLVATVPFLFRLHADPVDIGRYSPWSLKQQLEVAGFSKIQIEKQGLFWSVAIDMLRDWLRFLVISKRVRMRLAINIYSRIVSYCRKRAIAFDARPSLQDHDFYGRYVGGFGIFAVKP